MPLCATMQFTLQQSAVQGHFYQNVFQRFATREATLTTVESFCMEGIMAMGERKIEIRDFPVIVVIDSQGDNLYETAVKEFAG